MRECNKGNHKESKAPILISNFHHANLEAEMMRFRKRYRSEESKLKGGCTSRPDFRKQKQWRKQGKCIRQICHLSVTSLIWDRMQLRGQAKYMAVCFGGSSYSYEKRWTLADMINMYKTISFSTKYWEEGQRKRRNTIYKEAVRGRRS